MGVVQSRPNACVALCAFGSCLNLVWCTLMGHTLGFMPAADGMQGWTNPRAFFLAGILVISILFAAFPHGMRRWNRLFMSTLPLVASAGTACFALAYRQDLCDPGALAAFGLCVSGVGYFWLVARYNLLLARTQLFSCAVWSIVGALFAKLVLVEAFGASLDSGLQVGVAVALPIVSALVFEIARVAAKRQAERNPWVDPGIAARTQETKSRHVKAAYGKPGDRMLFLYGVMADHQAAVRDIVAAILSDDKPVLVHCANGKDRVGVVCASAQLVCGVPGEAVMADYLLTNECNAEMNKRDLAHYAGLMPPDAVEVLAAMFEAREEYLKVFVDSVEARFGSFNEWIDARL